MNVECRNSLKEEGSEAGTALVGQECGTFAPSCAGENGMIRQLREGDPEGLKELIRGTRDRLFSLALGICGDYADAEEVLQDVYMTVVRSINAFEGRSSLSTWLHRITVNAALMKRRKGKMDRNTMSVEGLGDILPGEVDGSPAQVFWICPQHDRLLSKEAMERVSDSVAGLPQAYRSVVKLRFLEGRSIRETGKILNLTPAAVKSRAFRARSILREDLKQHFHAN